MAITPPLNLNYSDRMEEGVPGMLADTAERGLNSRVAEEVIEYGVPISQGTMGDQSCKNMLAGERFMGIAVREHAPSYENYAVGDHVRMLRHDGAIFVTVVDAVVADEQVHAIPAAAPGMPGQFSNAGGVPINARFETSAPAGGIARMRLGGE